MMPSNQFQNVLVTGGAGYVGSRLVPRLVETGCNVRVLDLFIFGRDVLAPARATGRLEEIVGDLRDPATVNQAVAGMDAVIHLACVSNDPSFELDPALGRSINFDAFVPLVEAARDAGVRRFIYASSSSVYGVSDQPNVTEDHELRPLTDYSRFKAMCEPLLLERVTAQFVPVIVRPATVCGYAPRQRLDLIVNILTNHAVNNRRIRVFGGDQLRPNIHIEDMVRVYELLLRKPDDAIAGRIYNAGYENHSVTELATMIQQTVESEMPDLAPIDVAIEPTDDNRSYHICSDRIREELGFQPTRTIADAVRELVAAFRDGLLPDPMTDPRYYNVKVMQNTEFACV